MKKTTRRKAIQTIAVAAALAGTTTGWSTVLNNNKKKMRLKGTINHSVCRWTYGSLSLEQLCAMVKELGFAAIDLVGPKDWDTLKKHGIYSSMCNGAEINLVDGWNEPNFHSTLIKSYTEHIEYVAKAGYKNLICFSGNRRGMDDETGLKNCEQGLKKILSIAEKNKVTLVMELLNSKVDHHDYMCDHSAWGVALCKRLGSENFKLLYDIYHMQVDEGNVIATIRSNHQYFAHYHTAGVPGRHELNELQELNYPPIMKAIAATGFKGYVAQEFIPTGKTDEDRKQALKEAIAVCDV
ncbi:hydroxypyruvate isomerase family protein [Niabella drilacis]|uniref:Hydroxypyruvate isomerase n=1 Tax=Niabella drilacis (strain DSM 25811 / CCM 8410 / CCUG 62505 / LMG 26954 / E90) TaxID=1285928 RepID=A0A1G6W5A5_NIADE|nr:TIM barrel protein [Niabella drilacis]SDD61019.1 hydroxypyruvate isomerase [Niabella drilacis]